MAQSSVVMPGRAKRVALTDAELDRLEREDPEFYPSEEAVKMPETDLHTEIIALLKVLLASLFPPEASNYVAGTFLYWRRGYRSKRVAPDLYLVKGVSGHLRRTYLVWSEERTPNVVFEVLSRRTYKKDLGAKLLIYQDVLQVPEYFLCDPDGLHSDVALFGYRLIDGIYRRIEPVSGRLSSEQLGVHLGMSGGRIRLFDSATGAMLPTPLEAEAEARRSAEEQAKAEAEARLVAERQAAAEAEARLVAERQAAAAEQQAATEAAARHAAEREVERLREELNRLR